MNPLLPIRRFIPVLAAIALAPATLSAALLTADSADATIDTRDWVTLTIHATHGTVPGTGPQVLGSVIQLTATPDPGYVFAGWSGDATGTTNPQPLTLSSHKTVTATFTPDLADSDGDTVSNFEEVTVHGTNPGKPDTDDDGFKDGYEITHGFNPKSATSTPESGMAMFTAVELRFGAALGQSYRIESSTDMNQWLSVESGIVGTGGVITRFYTTQSVPKRFFRAIRE